MKERMIAASGRRLKQLQSALRKRQLGAYLAVAPVEVTYLSNFGGDDSWLFVPASGQATLITDFRYAEDAAGDSPHLKARLRVDSLAAEVAKLVRPGRPVACNPEQLTVSLRRRLLGLVGAGELKELPGVVDRMRAVKDDVEVVLIERTLRLAEAAYAEFLKRLRIGMTETELAAELEYAMRQQGASGPAFATICAVGSNASRPHHRPGGRRLADGAALLIDFGAADAGYRCDLTRMVFLNRIRPEVKKAYQAVLEAQLAAIAVAGPGVLSREVDAAARGCLARHGYARFFGHGTGHGLGLEIHESPSVSPKAGETVLQPGMVITIEPGVYLAGRFGIRIEDDLLITSGGSRVLSRLPKQLDEVTITRR